MSTTTPPAPDTPSPEGWFPTGRLDLGGWRFDVITLLAVIGEASVAVHAQTLTASTLCLLPRLIPAPQALLKGLRPRRLPEVSAKMAGVYGGTVLDTVGFFANILHSLDDLDAFEFQVWEIKHKPVPVREEGDEGWWGWVWRKRVRGKETKGGVETSEEEAAKGPSLERIREEVGDAQHVSVVSPAPVENGVRGGHEVDLEMGPLPPRPSRAQAQKPGPASVPGVAPDQPPGMQLPEEDTDEPGLQAQDGEAQTQDERDGIRPLTNRTQRQGSKLERVTDRVAGIDREVKKGVKGKIERYAVPPAFWSPLHIVSVLSCAMTVGLFVAARYWEDGTAMLAIIFISMASTVTCWASLWRPLLMNRPNNRVPKGDLVIRTRAGAFLVIKCREEVVRELYSGTEECQYVVGKYYRVIMGLGMVLLMVAVVLLGNCGWNSQALIGASYIFLNAVYWGLGLLPQHYFWYVARWGRSQGNANHVRDLKRYTKKEIKKDDYANAHKPPKIETDDVELNPSFTRTLWYAIRETKSVAWVERSGAMPMTEAWKKWLTEASAAARDGNRKWDAVGRKNKILQEAEELDNNTTGTTSWSTTGTSSVTQRRPYYEAAREVAPAETVQPPRAGTDRMGTL